MDEVGERERPPPVGDRDRAKGPEVTLVDRIPVRCGLSARWHGANGEIPYREVQDGRQAQKGLWNRAGVASLKLAHRGWCYLGCKRYGRPRHHPRFPREPKSAGGKERACRGSVGVGVRLAHLLPALVGDPSKVKKPVIGTKIKHISPRDDNIYAPLTVG